MDINNEMVFKSESFDDEVIGVISQYIIKHQDVRFDICEITSKTILGEIPHIVIDLLAIIGLTQDLEEKFNIMKQIPDEAIGTRSTVQDIIDVVTGILANKNT